MRLSCSICKGIYIPCSEVYVTSCGHLYHGSCISTWMKHNKTCPQCRANMSQSFRIYFDVENSEETDRVILEQHLEVLMGQLQEATKCKKDLADEKKKLLDENKNLLDEKKNLVDEKKNLEKIITDMQKSVKAITQKNDLLNVTINFYEDELRKLNRVQDNASRLEAEVRSLKAKVAILGRVETLIKGSAEDVSRLIESTPVTRLAVKNLCLYVGVLKGQVKKFEVKNADLIKKNTEISAALTEEKERPFKEKGIEELIKSLKDKIKKLENEFSNVNGELKGFKKKYFRKFQSLGPLKPSAYQDLSKKKVVEVDIESFLEEEFKDVKYRPAVKQNKTEEDPIARWEKLISDGPIINLALSKSRSRLYNNDDSGPSGSGTSYVHDGGTKRIKLGGPTPAVEFEQIKQRRAKKEVQAVPQKKIQAVPHKKIQAVPHKKIIEYFQID